MTKEEIDHQLDEIAALFKKNVSLEDRKYRLKTYKDCFIGQEAVDYLVSSGQAPTREDAVALGRALQGTHLFEHVTRDHEFADDYLFFRFLGENERGSFKVDDTTGERIDWSSFLSPSSGGNHDTLQPSLPQPDFDAVGPRDIHPISKVWPLDEYNTTLLNHVHPPVWVDPAPNNRDGTSDYDLVVVGGGTGGLISAAGSAGLGAKVALIEENMLGGDWYVFVYKLFFLSESQSLINCSFVLFHFSLNVGCVPSKAIIHSATLAHNLKGDIAHLEEAGIFLDPALVKVDFEKVMERVRKIRSEISHHDSAERYSKELGVEIYIGRGKFTSERTVEVNGRTLYFRKAVIATGAYPELIPMAGLAELHSKAVATEGNLASRPIVMTNETFFNLTKQPKKMVVIGAGVIGMELDPRKCQPLPNAQYHP